MEEPMLCGECGQLRFVDADGYVQTCPTCGDESFQLSESQLRPMPDEWYEEDF